VAEDRPLVEQLLDLALYAPIGAALTAADHVPALVAKGRSLLEGRVTLARMVGRMAVGTARRRLDDAVSRPDPARRARDPREEGDATAPPRETRASERDATHDRGPRPSGSPRAAPPASVTVPAAGDLAIPGYDALAASQVVQRLTSLSLPELDAVRRYEEATRSRRTILGRVAQLQSDLGARS